MVKPSLSTESSIRKGGLGGGGTKRPFQRPFSLSSKSNAESCWMSSMTIVASSKPSTSRPALTWDGKLAGKWASGSSSAVGAADGDGAGKDEGEGEGAPMALSKTVVNWLLLRIALEVAVIRGRKTLDITAKMMRAAQSVQCRCACADRTATSRHRCGGWSSEARRYLLPSGNVTILGTWTTLF